MPGLQSLGGGRQPQYHYRVILGDSMGLGGAHVYSKAVFDDADCQIVQLNCNHSDGYND